MIYIERDPSSYSGEISAVYYVLLEHIIWNLYHFGMTICSILNLNTLWKGFILTLLVYSDWLFCSAKCHGLINWLSMCLKWTRTSTRMKWVKTVYIGLLNTGEAYIENVCHHYDVIFLSYSLGELQRPYFQFVAGKEIKGVFNGKCCHHLSGTQDSSLLPILF